MMYNLDPSTLTKPGNLKQWVDDLPFANPTGVAEKISYALQQLNQYPKTLPNRGQLLELFLPPFERTIKSYQEIVLRQRDNDLKSSDRLLLEQTEKATKMLANGFKQCIKDDVLSNKSKQPEQAALLIYWALRCINLLRLFDFLYYRSPPPRTWREMGSLYRLGRKLNLLSQPVLVPSTKALAESTIEREYLRGILTTLLDPSRLTRDNIWSAYSYLCVWAPQAKLSDCNNPQPAADNFLIDLNTAEAIRPFDPSKVPDDGSRCLILDASLLNYLIEDQINSLLAKPELKINGFDLLNPEQAEQLLQYMYQNWHDRPKRRFVRTTQSDRLIAVRGLGAVCDFLERDGPAVPRQNKGRFIQRTDLEADAGKAWASSNSQASYDTFTWYQVNISDGGMAILADNSFINKSHIGQIILAKSQSATVGATWRLGVVRRAKQKNKISMELGIEFLRGKITPIEERPEIFGRRRQAISQPALLFLPKDAKAYTLITAPHSYHPDTLYVITNKNGDTKRVRSGELLQSSRHFQQFECFPLKLHGEDK